MDNTTVRSEPGRRVEQSGDAGNEPAIGTPLEDISTGVDAVPLMEVSFNEGPVLEDQGGSYPAFLAVAFRVVVPVREARFRVVVAAPVWVRVSVRRAALFGGSAFPPAFQNRSAISSP